MGGKRMSIYIGSLSDWLRCIGSSLPAEHHAALARLVRMLSGDAQRPRPPVSLPGNPRPAAARISTPAYLPATPRYPHQERLLKMNARFVETVERAIRLGLERPEGERPVRAA